MLYAYHFYERTLIALSMYNALLHSTVSVDLCIVNEYGGCCEGEIDKSFSIPSLLLQITITERSNTHYQPQRAIFTINLNYCTQSTMPHLNLEVGQTVEAWCGTRGIVKYIGPVRDLTQVRVGLEEFTPHGYCDGSWHGERYYACPESYGCFIYIDTIRHIMSEESSVSYKLQGIEARTKSLKDLEKRSSLMMKYTPKRMAKAVLDLAESTSQLVQSLRSDIESTTQP
jgi:hypothetical protein